MLPMIVKLRVRKDGRTRFRLWFPVILVWLILFALLLLLLPLVLLAALITWRSGPGKALLMIYPYVFSIFWTLSGLHIDVGDARDGLLISFQ